MTAATGAIHANAILAIAAVVKEEEESPQKDLRKYLHLPLLVLVVVYPWHPPVTPQNQGKLIGTRTRTTLPQETLRPGRGPT